MAPLEYTLTITLPSVSSAKPVDCRYSGSSLTNAPVSAATGAFFLRSACSSQGRRSALTRPARTG
jgi:hypothetical protein